MSLDWDVTGCKDLDEELKEKWLDGLIWACLVYDMSGIPSCSNTKQRTNSSAIQRWSKYSPTQRPSATPATTTRGVPGRH